MGNKIAKLSLLSVLALIAFLLESLLPPLIFPGAKLGLGNIFIMLALLCYGLYEGLIILAVKTVLSAIIGGNLFSLSFSLTAGIASVLVMYLLLKFFKKSISYTAISAAAGVVHNLIQLLVFSLINGNASVNVYAPYLALIGILSGTITGLSVNFLANLINKRTTVK